MAKARNRSRGGDTPDNQMTDGELSDGVDAPDLSDTDLPEGNVGDEPGAIEPEAPVTDNADKQPVPLSEGKGGRYVMVDGQRVKRDD